MNEEAQEKFGRPMLNFYKEQGLFEACEGIEGVAQLIGCSVDNIKTTLDEYAESAKAKICPKTNKVVFPSMVTSADKSFIAARITPCIHYCMGGLEISPQGEVLANAAGGAMGRRCKVKRLFAAGEVTGGVHGENRLGGNSLLECVVFGRIAGERAATIKQKTGACFVGDEWVPLTLREIRATDGRYGHNTAVFRFNLNGALQQTGLEVGRFISIRGEFDGDTVTGYYSPISRPQDEGVIDILCRTDDKGGPIVNLLMSLRPGASCKLKSMGGIRLTRQPCLEHGVWEFAGRRIRKLSLLSGGTGLAPAVQIARAYFNALGSVMPVGEGGVKVVYAAEHVGDLAFVEAFENLKKKFPTLIQTYMVLNNPPPGWTQGIGFVDQDTIRERLWFPPADDTLVVMCGPPIFEKIMCGNLSKMGYARDHYYSFNDDPAN